MSPFFADTRLKHWHSHLLPYFFAATIAVGVVALFACGGEKVTDPPPNPNTNPVASVVVAPGNDTLFSAGATVQTSASASDAGGSTISGKTFAWTSSDNDVASVDSTGLVTATGPNGSATITATTDGVSGTATILVAAGPQGGTIVAASGQVTLEVPAGALAGVLSITVAPASGFPDATSVVGGTAFDLGPDGTVFTSPVDLTIEYDPAEMPAGADENWLRLHRLSGSDWTVVPGGAVDVAENTVTGAISGFSTFGVLEVEGVVGCTSLLESVLDSAINRFARVEPIDLDNLDRFSFGPVQQCFQEAYDAAASPEWASERQTAAFGLAVTTLLALEDNANLHAAADDWDLWLETNYELEHITGGTGDMPPTLAEQQALLSDIVEPAFVTALSLLSEVDDPAFVFLLTPRMQGENPANTTTLELDQSEVLALRAAIEAWLAIIDILQAYQMVPSPYGPAGFSAAMAGGSTFLALDPGETSRLTDAQERLIRAVNLMGQALDFLVGETDDQTDDVVGYAAAGSSLACDLDYTGRLFPCRMNAGDVQDLRDILTDVGGMLAGPHTVTQGSGLGGDLELNTDVVVDASAFFTDPIANLKSLLPAYEVSNGTFHWAALAFDEWLFPDPDLNGILPNITSSDELKGIFGGDDLWRLANYDIDEWASVTVNPSTGNLSAITNNGDLYLISSDFSSGADRPDIAVAYSYGSNFRLSFGTAESVLFAIDYEGRIYSRPDDNATAWSERLNLAFYGLTRLVEIPGSSGYATVRSSTLFDIASDFSTYAYGPSLPYSIESFMANATTVELVAISYDGLVYARPPDAVTEWTQRYTLPFAEDRWDQRWQGITQAPGDGDMFAITRNGDLYEIASNFSTATDRPDVPATNVVDLIASPAGLLIALTEDGRVFSRPDDSSTPWALRFTLPRNVQQY